jgi:hypothetical protein
VNYIRQTSDFVGTTRTTNTTLLLRLELKHLGQVNYRQSLTPATPDSPR